jgi:hypothetical protein
MDCQSWLSLIVVSATMGINAILFLVSLYSVSIMNSKDNIYFTFLNGIRSLQILVILIISSCFWLSVNFSTSSPPLNGLKNVDLLYFLDLLLCLALLLFSFSYAKKRNIYFSLSSGVTILGLVFGVIFDARLEITLILATVLCIWSAVLIHTAEHTIIHKLFPLVPLLLLVEIILRNFTKNSLTLQAFVMMTGVAILIYIVIWEEFIKGLLRNLAKTREEAQARKEAQEKIEVLNQELTEAYDTTLEGWARALELKDKETEGHSRRVTDLSVLLATNMGLPEKEQVNIRYGALLHDIGKMAIPDEILQKPGPLTEEERRVIMTHPVIAYNLLKDIDHLRDAIVIPYAHHERWDGNGYPRKLRGDGIPLYARIFAVVDVWDAVTHDRPYQKARSLEEAVEILKSSSGSHLDPQIVEIFLKIIA